MNKGPALAIHLTNGWFIVTFDYGVLDGLYNGEQFVFRTVPSRFLGGAYCSVT